MGTTRKEAQRWLRRVELVFGGKAFPQGRDPQGLYCILTKAAGETQPCVTASGGYVMQE